MFQVTIRSGSNYQIVFEGISGSSYQGDIAIDDVKVSDNACPPPGDCNFESGMCTWVNTKGDVFDWTRNSGTTPSFQTGPSVDHTLGTKFGKKQKIYIFLRRSIYKATCKVQSIDLMQYWSLLICI